MYIVFSLVVYVYISVYLCMSIYPNNNILYVIKIIINTYFFIFVDYLAEICNIVLH